MKYERFSWVFLLLLVLALGGCTSKPSAPVSQTQGGEKEGEPQATFTLQTAMMDGKMVYVGSGGSIDGLINPDLEIGEGITFQIVLVNDDGMPHDLAVPEIGFQTGMALSKGQSVSITGSAPASGEYIYFCTVSGHRQAGMEGRLVVGEP